MKWADEQNKVYTEYTGGGIWIAYMYVSKHIYYCTGTSDYEFSKFDDRKENEEEGMLMGMVWDHWYGDDAEDDWDWPCKITLTKKEEEILSRLLAALDDTYDPREKWGYSETELNALQKQMGGEQE